MENNESTLLGYLYNERQQRYYEVHIFDDYPSYVECEPTDVDESKLFFDDPLHGDGVAMINSRNQNQENDNIELEGL